MECPTEPPKTKITRKTVLFPLIGLAAFFLYIYLFKVDLPEIIATAQRADPFPYILAVILSLAEVFFFAISWRVLANFLLIKLSIMKSYLLVKLASHDAPSITFGAAPAAPMTTRHVVTFLSFVTETRAAADARG